MTSHHGGLPEAAPACRMTVHYELSHALTRTRVYQNPDAGTIDLETFVADGQFERVTANLALTLDQADTLAAAIQAAVAQMRAANAARLTVVTA